MLLEKSVNHFKEVNLIFIWLLSSFVRPAPHPPAPFRPHFGDAPEIPQRRRHTRTHTNTCKDIPNKSAKTITAQVWVKTHQEPVSPAVFRKAAKEPPLFRASAPIRRSYLVAEVMQPAGLRVPACVCERELTMVWSVAESAQSMGRMKFAVALLCVSLAAVKDAVKGKTHTTRTGTVEDMSGVNRNAQTLRHAVYPVIIDGEGRVSQRRKAWFRYVCLWLWRKQ